MSMGLGERGRIRWIRTLIVILALTASRANFPLLRSPFRPSPAPCTVTEPSMTRLAKKGDEAMPSRRQVESRRIDWIKALTVASELPPSLKAVLSSWKEEIRPRTFRPACEACVASTLPDYLQVFLRSPASSSLPPPA